MPHLLVLTRLRVPALVLATAGGILSCLDNPSLGPGHGSTAQVGLHASISGLRADGDYTLEVRISLADSEEPRDLPIEPDAFALGPEDATAQPITIDLSACPEGCRLSVILTLTDNVSELASDTLDLGMVRQGDRIEPADTIRMEPLFDLTIVGGGEGTGSGTVSVTTDQGPSGWRCEIVDGESAQTGCSARYPLHAEITLSAAPVRGAVLESWSGDCEGTAPGENCQLTIEGRRTVGARFGPPPSGDLRLVFGGQPETVTAGVPISPPVTVEVRDDRQQLVTDFTGRIGLSLRGGPSNAMLGGTLDVAPVEGVATFRDVTVDLAATGYVLVASASTLPSVETAPFTVVPGLVSPDRSSVEVRPDALRTCCDTADVIVTARDAAGNSVPGASVTLAANDALVSVVSPILPTNANGVTVGGVAARAIGTKSISATIAGVEVAAPATVEVSAGLVFRLLQLRVGEIVTTYPDRSQPANLSRTPRPEDDPSWAPDGSRVAYVVTPCSECETEIYSMSADGTDTLNLTANLSGNAFSPAWSNDGSSIAFTAEAQVFLMNADGSNPTNLTGEGGGSHPAWSPGGERIAYTRRVCDAVCRDDIWVRQLAQDTASILSGALNGLSTAPAFSPDGRTIAFAFRPCETCVADVYTMSAVDGSNVIPLTRGSPGSVESLDWSPDGAQIVFATECTSAPCDGELYVMNADGSGLDQLGPGSHPDWR